MEDRLHICECYSGPVFWQRLRILFCVWRGLHRIERRQGINFDFMLF